MSEQSITPEQFDAGIELFVEILNAQPNYLSPTGPASQAVGHKLAEMAVAFSSRYNTLMQQHCRD